jgi:potassium efflux system protein
MYRDKLPPSRVVVATLFTVILILPFRMWAQEKSATQGGAAPSEPKAIQNTVEEIQLRLKQTEDAKDIDEATKAQVIDLYKQALDELARAEEWKTKAREFERAREQAPALLESVKLKLAEPAQEPKPESFSDAPLPDLEQRLAEAQAELSAAEKEQTELEGEPKRRTDRRVQVPALAAAARERLDSVGKELSAPAPPTENPLLTAAKQARLEAQKQSIESELNAYDKEILSYDARSDLLRYRRDLAAQRAAQARKVADSVQEVVNERRAMEAARQARDARVAALSSHPALREQAEYNRALAERRTGPDGLTAKIEQATRELDAINAQRADLENQFNNTRAKAEAAGLTNAVGLLLRKQRAGLPDVRRRRRNVRQRPRQIADVQLALLDVEHERAALADIGPETQRIMDGIQATLVDTDREDIKEALRALLETRKLYLEALSKDYDQYFAKLIDLDSTERELIKQTQSFAEYIDEKVLWIRSTTPLNVKDVREGWRAARWLTRRDNWVGLVTVLWHEIRGYPALMASAVLVLVAVITMRQRLGKRLELLGEAVSRDYVNTFSQTIVAFLFTLSIALCWPLIMWFFAWRLSAVAEESEFVQAFAAGLGTTGFVFLTMDLFRQVCRRKGLGEVHFRWPQPGLQYIRGSVSRLMAVVLPLAFVTAMLEREDSEPMKNSLGRLAFIAVILLLGLSMRKLLHPQGALLQEKMSRLHESWLYKLRHVWYPVAIGTPLFLAGLAAVGYYYTALQLAWRLVATALLVLGLLVINAIVIRWLWIARWRLAAEGARKPKAASASEDQDDKEQTRHESADQPELSVGIHALSDQTRQILRFLMAFALLVGVYLIWVDVLPALNMFLSIRLPHSPDISLADIAFALMSLLMAVVAVKNIPGLVELLVLKRLPLGAGERYAVTTICRYLISIIGVVIACGALGITWSKVQWLLAAMTVGLGFGLQEIFGNFVSGLIILFERPIRVGDTVTIGDVSGTVSRIRIRATTVTDFNRKELIVPNKEFVTGKLVNWTLSDQVLRLVVPVGVAYGSDTEQARKLLVKVAKEHPAVMAEPEPTAHFLGFGDSSLQLELWAFVPDFQSFIRARNELYTAVAKTFRDAGIEIAFPQRDIHIRSIHQTLPIIKKPEEK